MTALRAAAVTDVGRVRSVNQDGALTSEFLVAVADGMGGHRAGEVASAVALRSLAGHDHFGSADDLVDAVQQANSAIFRRATDTPSLRGMGTTLCALALVDGGPDGGSERLALVNVGDSRAYQLREGDLAQLTIDHSLVQMMVREGKLQPEEAANHPQRNIVLRRSASSLMWTSTTGSSTRSIGDRFLVCSDGLFNEISQGRMAATLRTYAEPAEAAKVLVGLANAAGGRDNITCVVVDVVADAGTAEPDTAATPPTRRTPPPPPERRPGSGRPPPTSRATRRRSRAGRRGPAPVRPPTTPQGAMPPRSSGAARRS